MNSFTQGKWICNSYFTAVLQENKDKPTATILDFLFLALTSICAGGLSVPILHGQILRNIGTKKSYSQWDPLCLLYCILEICGYIFLIEDSLQGSSICHKVGGWGCYTTKNYYTQLWMTAKKMKNLLEI